jgi:hypothetical protein
MRLVVIGQNAHTSGELVGISLDRSVPPRKHGLICTHVCHSMPRASAP